MKCEYCGKKHDGSYCSGRFCSKKCSKASSTKNDKNNTKKINCVKCGIETIVGKRAPHSTQCLQCRIKIKKLKESKKIRPRQTKNKGELKDLLSKKRIEAILAGKINMPTKVIYEGILCDSKLEACAIKYLKSIGETNIIKNKQYVIEYKYNGTIKRFIPDFITDNLIVEVKSDVYNSLNIKWHNYRDTIEAKKEALNKLALNLNKRSLWLDKTNKDFLKLYRKEFVNCSVA